jgi:hypothetical protein
MKEAPGRQRLRELGGEAQKIRRSTSPPKAARRSPPTVAAVQKSTRAIRLVAVRAGHEEQEAV